jgi:hypothetical protein
MPSCLLAFCLLVSSVAAADKSYEQLWEKAIVTVEVTRKEYDYLQPWSVRVDQIQKMGTIIDGKEILTTADALSDHTLIRVQKGRGRWYLAQVAWIDYSANLASISVPDEKFWDDTESLELAKVTPRRGVAQLLRWRNGILEIRNVDISRLVVKKGKLTFMDQLQLELDSDMNGIGWAEAIVQENHLIALATSKDDQTITSLPSAFIRPCLADRKDAKYQGLGYFSFVWETAENPDTLAFLGQKGEPRGVIVIEVHTNKLENVLKPRDIILEIDGFNIDVQGDYKDPDYGNLLLENLASRSKRAGDKVAIKIMRDGKEQTVDYVLPKADYNAQLVPLEVFDQEPEYLILGGLVFQPLSVPYLESWGSDWPRKAPFRLSYATRQDATFEDPSYVVLSSILPDPINIGYNDARYMIVDKVNGKKVRTLQDLLGAKNSPNDGFDLIEFKDGDTMQRMILDANELDAATARVLKRYGIDKDRSLALPAKDKLVRN